MDAEPEGSLEGVRVLIVEDEPLVAMLLEDMLSDLGCIVAGAASTLAEAVALASDAGAAIDVAILDVNLGRDSSAPVAEALAARGAPFVFATGYGESGVPEAFRGRPTLQKPFGMHDVARMLAKAVGR